MHTLTPKIEVALTTSRSLWYHTLRLWRLGIQVGWRNQRKGRRVFGEWGATTRSSSQRYIPNRVQVGCLVVLCAITPTGYCIIPRCLTNRNLLRVLTAQSSLSTWVLRAWLRNSFLDNPVYKLAGALAAGTRSQKIMYILKLITLSLVLLGKEFSVFKACIVKIFKISFVSGIPAFGQSLPSNSHPAAHDCLCGLKTDIKQRHSL